MTKNTSEARNPATPDQSNLIAQLKILNPIYPILLLALVIGTFFNLSVLPWQHYDEPGHFERLWLTARGIESTDIDDPQRVRLRREIASSMVENKFFSDQGTESILALGTGATWIGVSQLTDRPLYYWVASIPLKATSTIDIITQLQIVRFISGIMYVLTIFLAYRTTRELTADGNILRILVPLCVALTPGFADLMSAANNDVAAVFIFSLFILGSVRLIHLGFSIPRFLILIVLTSLSLLTKITISLALPLAFIALGLSVFPRSFKHQRLVYLITFLGLILVLQTILVTGDAAFWYRNDPSHEVDWNTKTTQDEAVLGKAALQIKIGQDNHARSEILFQPYSPAVVRSLRGRPVTFGAWIWSDTPTTISMPYLWTDVAPDNAQTKIENVDIDREPSFLTFQNTIPDSANYMHLVLFPGLDSANQGKTIYYDALVLTEGSFSGTPPPEFTGRDGETGVWQGFQFENLIRNGSAENTWVTLSPPISKRVDQLLPVDSYRIMTSLVDIPAFGWLYRLSITNLFESYWARFGWNQISIPSIWYWLIGFFTFTGLLGSAAGILPLWKNKSRSWKFTIIWLALVCFLFVMQAILRTGPPIFGGSPFIPSARYAYAAIIPFTLILVSGWLTIFKLLNRPKFGPLFTAAFYTALLLVSIISINSFTNGLN